MRIIPVVVLLALFAITSSSHPASNPHDIQRIPAHVPLNMHYTYQRAGNLVSRFPVQTERDRQFRYFRQSYEGISEAIRSGTLHPQFVGILRDLSKSVKMGESVGDIFLLSEAGENKKSATRLKDLGKCFISWFTEFSFAKLFCSTSIR